MTTLLKKRLTTIRQEWVNPQLHSLGFQRQASRYERWFENIGWIIELQQDQWNTDQKIQFTVNCGVYVAGAMELYLNRPSPKRISVADCCLHTRIGMLSKDRLDKWWELRVDNGEVSDRAIGEDLACRLKENVIPFFNRFVNATDVMMFLVNPRASEDKHIWPQSDAIAFCYAAGIALTMQQPDQVNLLLRRAIEAASGSPVEETVLRFRDRLPTTPQSYHGCSPI